MKETELKILLRLPKGKSRTSPVRIKQESIGKQQKQPFPLL